MAQLLDGRALAEELFTKQVEQIAKLKEKNVFPGLAVILVGEDPASKVYVRNKEEAARKLGILSKCVRLSENVSQETLVSEIEKLNLDETIHGILVQLPLPKHINERLVLQKISPDKDVDGFHDVNAGRLFKGNSGIIPCTPKGIMYMLDSIGVDLSGKNAVIIGRSNIVGKPIASLLTDRNCTTTLCHSKTNNLDFYTKNADILVVAIGKAKFIKASMVKEGAIVIDVGINRVDGKLCGDVDFDDVFKKASFISPVPGGVGKMTIAMLMQNTLEVSCKGEF